MLTIFPSSMRTSAPTKQYYGVKRSSRELLVTLTQHATYCELTRKTWAAFYPKIQKRRKFYFVPFSPSVLITLMKCLYCICFPLAII